MHGVKLMGVNLAVKSLIHFSYIPVATPLAIYEENNIVGLARGFFSHSILLTRHVASEFLPSHHQYWTQLAPHSPRAPGPQCLIHVCVWC